MTALQHLDTRTTSSPQEDDMSTTTATTDTADLEALREQAEQGQRAAERLAAAEHERQAQRTVELAREQAAYDVDLATRGATVDDGLSAERREAAANLQAAVERSDLDAAFTCWRVEAGLRIAQRLFRNDWRAAHERAGIGQPPPPESLRTAETDEALAFLPTLERAAAASAALEAEVRLADLLTERPTALPHEVLPGDASSLVHDERCPDPSRTEITTPPVGRYSTGKVARCLACSASKVLYLPPPEPEDEQAAAPGPGLLRRPAAGELPAGAGWVS